MKKRLNTTFLGTCTWQLQGSCESTSSKGTAGLLVETTGFVNSSA